MRSEELIGQIIEDDIDTQVKNYLTIIGDVKRNEILHKRVNVPSFSSNLEKQNWQKEEIKRCREGHKGMCGKHYFYFNYCFIKSVKGGRIVPEWRRTDSEFFNLWESCMRGLNKGKGILALKRRRIGASWKFAAGVLHEAMFYPYSEIGLQSKTEDDVKILFNDKLKFIYDNLPPFMRATSDAGNSLKKIEFAKKVKDEKGNPVKVGTRSLIVCKSPEDSNWEGMGLKLWGCDEAGKTKKLLSLVSLTYPCLAGDDGLTMEGVPFLFGTAGNIDDFGDDYKVLWYSSDSYNLLKYFISGWHGLKLDKFGNEDIEAAVRWILEERQKKEELSPKEYFDFIQQYPLTPEEAFSQGSSSPFDLIKINKRISELDKNPPKLQYGYFEWDKKNPEQVIFRPDSQGLVCIFEHPDRRMDKLYVAGSDPYDHRKKKGSGSSGSTCIYKRFYIDKQEQEDGDIDEVSGYMRQMPVMMFTDEGGEPNFFYQQSLMACIYYNCQILVEKNRAGMLNYFRDNSREGLLKTRPIKPNKVKFTASNYELGIYMDEDTKSAMLGAIGSYISNNIDGIYFVELLEKMLTYDSDNAKKKWDEVDAFGIALLHANDRVMTPVRTVEERKSSAIDFGFKRKGGKLVRS